MKNERHFLRITFYLVIILMATSNGHSQKQSDQRDKMAVSSSDYDWGQIVQFDQPIAADQYIIRPGDELSVTFLRANIEPLTLTVDPEGRIIHGNLGLFDLSHRTLAQARQDLTEALRNLFKIDKIIISINRPVLMRYSIVGAVDSPGFYQGFNSQRVSDAVEMAGGVSSGGSTRRIELSGGPHKLPADLDLASFTGDLKSNPCLYAGYVIFVPQKSDSRVQVIGEVNDPREIELLDGDSVERLISLAGGFRSWADSASVQVIRNGSVLNSRDTIPQSGDIIKVKALSDVPEFKRVSIYGAVSSPGRFPSDGAASLKALVSRAGGFTADAVVGRTTVFRYNPVDAAGRISIERFPIQNVASSGSSNFEFQLEPGDSVFVPYPAGYVEVNGLVVYPGSFPFQTDKSAEYYINLAGGYLPEANRAQIEIYDSISKITSQYSPKVNVHDGSKIIVGRRRELQ